MTLTGTHNEDTTTLLMERAAEALRVLGHPDRLRIIQFLAACGSAPVHGIEEQLTLGQSITSTHLQHLRKAGIVRGTRRGKEVWYQVTDPRAFTILECLQGQQGDLP